MSSPRLEPWLIPLTISSASKPSIRPSVAKRTQSTGVPSVAYPTVPSSKSTSSTHSGRRIVIERAVAERLPSGAITASSMPSTLSSSRRRACRPCASMPSSLVSRTRTAGQATCGAVPCARAARRPPSVAVSASHAGSLVPRGEAQRQRRGLDRAGDVRADRRRDHQRPVVRAGVVVGDRRLRQDLLLRAAGEVERALAWRPAGSGRAGRSM